MNKHIHILPDGTKATRGSKSRIYTHVVIGRSCRIRERDQVVSQRDGFARNFEFYQHYVNTPIGESWNDRNCTTHPETHAQYAATVAEHGTAEAYADARVKAALERIGEGDFGPWCVLQWSMSEANAAKAIGRWSQWYVDVQVQRITGE